MNRELVGRFSSSVIEALNLSFPIGTPIYIGPNNIEHIKKRHPCEFDQYFPDIKKIIKSPDYVGINPSDSSICFVKLYQVNSEYIRVAVRTTNTGTCYIKSLHLLSTCNAERYIECGTLKKLKIS